MADASLTSKIDQLIWDLFAKSSDIIIQGRRAVTTPILNPAASFSYADNTEYCSTILKSWKKNVSLPVVLDLYLMDTSNNKNLLERWLFVYHRKEDSSKDNRLGLVTRKIVTLLRTLYCFVRLLPGFHFFFMFSSFFFVELLLTCLDPRSVKV